MPKTSRKRKSESDVGRKSSQRDESRVIDSDSLPATKSKRIIKANRIDYVAFYKEMTAHLHREHPRWTINQVSSLVRLEWKKRKIQMQKTMAVLILCLIMQA